MCQPAYTANDRMGVCIRWFRQRGRCSSGRVLAFYCLALVIPRKCVFWAGWDTPQDVVRLPPPGSLPTNLWIAREPVHDAGPTTESAPKEQVAENKREVRKRSPMVKKADDSGKDVKPPPPPKDDEKEFKPERLNAYGQFTSISQWHNPFPSPYIGPHSFLPDPGTGHLSHRDAVSRPPVLQGGNGFVPEAEAYFNPELAGGRGLSDVFGLGAVPDGDITRVGSVEPTPYVARLYMNLTWGFGGEQEKIESAANQLAGYKDVSRLTVAFGELALPTGSTTIATATTHGRSSRTGA